MPLKVISYNIWNGFEAEEYQGNFIEFILSENPDVMALQELCEFTPAMLQTLSAEYGHKHSVLLKQQGYPVGITAKTAITVIRKQVDGYWHGFLHVKINGIHYIVIHLSPGPHEYRLKELGQLSGYLESENLNAENCVILGDFNSFSEIDAQASAVDEFDVIKGFEDVGFIDSMRAVDYHFTESFPTPLIRKEDSVLQRIDFQLCSRALHSRVTRSEIIRSELTNAISDHYPLVVEYK